MVGFLFCFLGGGWGWSLLYIFFSPWGIIGYNVVLVSGAEHNDLLFV